MSTKFEENKPQLTLNGFKAHEDDTLSRHDTTHTRHCSPIEASQTFFPGDLDETVQSGAVQVRVSTLHSSLHHIYKWTMGGVKYKT